MLWCIRNLTMLEKNFNGADDLHLTTDELSKIVFIVDTLISLESIRHSYILDFLTIIDNVLSSENGPVMT